MNWKQRQFSFNLDDRDRPGPIGLVFDIQRFAVHDGSGIRTLVFLKGCPLNCKWCQNPESISAKPELMRIPHACIACSHCVSLCPTQAISLNQSREMIINYEKCNLCGKCVARCYSGSMTIVGRYLNVQEVMDEVKRDQAFYSESGGGVTFSGGEPTLQTEFLQACLREAKKMGLHTAIETCAQAPWSSFESILDYLDLVLCDVKHTDSARHRELTGMGNERILENITRISQAGIPVQVRVPLVPGANDSRENIEATARFVNSLPTALGMDILPYHRLGEPKWSQLGRDYPLSGVKPPQRELVFDRAQLARQYVDQVNIGG